MLALLRFITKNMPEISVRVIEENKRIGNVKYLVRLAKKIATGKEIKDVNILS